MFRVDEACQALFVRDDQFSRTIIEHVDFHQRAKLENAHGLAFFSDKQIAEIERVAILDLPVSRIGKKNARRMATDNR